jgi:hypothetical protein
MRRWIVWMVLVGHLLWSLPAGAASPQLTNPGVPITFGDTGQTPAGGGTLIVWTLSNRTSGTGRISARADLGAGAHAALWELRCRFSFTGTNVVGSALEVYLATSDGTNPDAEVGTADAALTADQRRALLFVGLLPVYQTASNTTMTVSFRNLYLPQRYVSAAMWNATGLPTETSTTKHRCVLTPMTPEMQ